MCKIMIHPSFYLNVYTFLTNESLLPTMFSLSASGLWNDRNEEIPVSAINSTHETQTLFWRQAKGFPTLNDNLLL